MLISHLFPATLQGPIKTIINIYVLWIWGALRPETHSLMRKKVYFLLLGTDLVDFGIQSSVLDVQWTSGDFALVRVNRSI